MEVDATPPSPVGSVSVKSSPDVTPGEDHVVRVDIEEVEDIGENVELFAAIGTKVKPRTWVKKHESQACNRDKLKLKTVVLHDDSKEDSYNSVRSVHCRRFSHRCLSSMELISIKYG